MDLYDPPIQISGDDTVISGVRFSHFLNSSEMPKFEATKDGNSEAFTSQHNQKKTSTKANYGIGERHVNLFENQIVNQVLEQFIEEFGGNNVTREFCTEFGTQVDLVVKEVDGLIFYEFKTSNNIRKCIRQALSQLLEYAYYPNEERAKKLVIVSPNKMNPDAQEYLEKLRSDLSV